MSRHRCAFSLLEVMISIAVLAIVFGGVASNMATMEEVRRLAVNRQIMNDLAKSITYRLMTADWSSIVDANRGELLKDIDGNFYDYSWAQARFVGDSEGTQFRSL